MKLASPQWFLAKKTCRLLSKPISRRHGPRSASCTSQITSWLDRMVFSSASTLGLPPSDPNPSRGSGVDARDQRDVLLAEFQRVEILLGHQRRRLRNRASAGCPGTPAGEVGGRVSGRDGVLRQLLDDVAAALEPGE